MSDSVEPKKTSLPQADLPLRDEAFTPAVGIVAETHQFDATLRAIHRARARDFPVLLACDDPELLRFEEQYDFEMIDVSPGTIDQPILRKHLVKEARIRGCPGIIIHENPETWIEYEQTVDTLNERPHRYSVRAKTTVPPVQQENRTTLAAIPAYNEAKTIAKVVEETGQVVDKVLVIDDGSDDDTADRAREAGAVVIDHHRNRGYGATVKTALQAANQHNAEHLVLIDGDGQHDPKTIPELLAAQRTGDAELVIGSRYVDEANSGIPVYRQIGLAIINRFVNMSFWALNGTLRVRDTQSGFRVFNRQAIQTLAEDDWIDDGMAASIDVLYHADRHGFTIREIGTEIAYDDTESTHHPIKHGFSIISHIAKIIEGQRPFLFLGLPGGIVLSMALLGMYAFAHNLVPTVVSFPAAILTAVFVFVGTVAVGTYSVLHGLEVHSSRRRFS